MFTHMWHTYLSAFPRPFLSNVLIYGVLTMLGPGDQSEEGRVPALTVLPGVCGERASRVELSALHFSCADSTRSAC